MATPTDALAALACLLARQAVHEVGLAGIGQEAGSLDAAGGKQPVDEPGNKT